MDSWGVYDAESAYEMDLEYPDQTGTTARFRDIWDFRVRVYKDWLDDLEQVNPAAWWLIHSTRYTHSDGTAAYIAFMVERMMEVRRILKPTGTVYLHCDHEANAYLRQMMDAVFGKNNFRNEIVWETHNSPQRGSQHMPKSWGKVYETILFYGKSNVAKIKPFRELTEDERLAKFDRVDEDGRRYYDDSAHIWSTPNMGARPNLCYEWKGFRNPHPSGWRLAKHRMDEEYAKGNFVILDTDNGKRLQRRKYEDDWRGASIGNLWTHEDVPSVRDGDPEDTGYPTQKPQLLAKRIIEASTEPDDIVLDCFAGCAYVPVAAELTGRRWIACDMSPRAWTVIRRQFHKHPDLAIITEGQHLDAFTPRLEHSGKVIRVRGPLELPEKSVESKSLQRRFRVSQEITFKQKPVENGGTIWEAFVDEWGTGCWYCGGQQQRDRRFLQLDHIEPNKRDGTNDDCWNRALACVACNGDKGNALTVEETMDKALASGRIATPALREEQAGFFETRHQWAKRRWDSIKPRRLDGMEV